MKHTFVFVLLFFSAFYSYAQLSDLARIDFTIIPKNSSGIEYTRNRALFNYPIKLKKEKEFLLLGLDYSNIHLNIEETNLPFNKEALDDFQILDLNISYTKPLKNDWRLGLRLTPGFSTNLTARSLSFEDLTLSGLVAFIKDKKNDKNESRPWKLTIGVYYSDNGGFSFPLPFISYYRKFREKWSFNLGVPKSNLQYHLNENHRIKFITELEGYNSNIQGRLNVSNTNDNATTIKMSLLLSGLQYEFHFKKHFQFYTKASYILSNSVKLRNNNGTNIFTIDNDPRLYIRAGIRLKI
ncbi:MAG: DUF6268 family outer membrane beta-barrel protein [Psychroserpens sp.]|uniref:DUF6268 family outer membrane beta-barrel protein n=1 Tax=Psychroserpens sp. TaxID=2020870 RepID=UPI003001F9DB